MEDPQSSHQKVITSVKDLDPEEKEIEQKMVKMINSMPPQVQDRFKILKALADQRSSLSDEFDKEVEELSKKYQELKRPLYEKRSLIVMGEVTDFEEYKPKYDETFKKLEEDCAKITKKGDKDDEEEYKERLTDVQYLKGVNGIPDFWFKAMKNS